MSLSVNLRLGVQAKNNNYIKNSSFNSYYKLLHIEKSVPWLTTITLALTLNLTYHCMFLVFL